MSPDQGQRPPRPSNRGFRPPPKEYDEGYAALPRDRTMTDFQRACLRWASDRPDEVLRVLAPYWPDSRGPGRPPGARDRHPRELRGGGQWWAVWIGSELRDLVSGPRGADDTLMRERLGLVGDPDCRLEPCDGPRARALHGWDSKSERDKALLRRKRTAARRR